MPVSASTVNLGELQTFRTQDLSFLAKTFRSQERKVPMENFRFRDLSFPGTFVLGELKFPGTFVPEPFRSGELLFPLSDRPSRRFALCA